MVDNFANQKVSDFMTKGFEDQQLKSKGSMDNPSQASQMTEESKGGLIAQQLSNVRTHMNSIKTNLTALTGISEYEGNTMTINEEVKVTEWAPAVFHAIKKMDNVTSEMIEESLSTDRNAK